MMETEHADKAQQLRPQERILFAVLAVALGLLSGAYSTLSGWGFEASPVDRLLAALPVLALSAATGLGAVSLAALALGRRVWAWYLLLGLAPALLHAAQLLVP